MLYPLQLMLRWCGEILQHHNVPGYDLLPWLVRMRLNLVALGHFVGSLECLRLVLCLTVWLLAGFNLVWVNDLRGWHVSLPLLLASSWVWPWLAAARRRWLHRLMGQRWPLR